MIHGQVHSPRSSNSSPGHEHEEVGFGKLPSPIQEGKLLTYIYQCCCYTCICRVYEESEVEREKLALCLNVVK